MLLPISKNRPHVRGDVQVCRDFVCLYFDVRSDRFECCVNGQLTSGETVDDFRAFIDGLVEEKEKANRKKTTRKIIAFVNDLDIVSVILPEGEKSSMKKRKNGREYIIEIFTDHFDFRNFNVLANGTVDSIQDIFKKSPAESMYLFVSMFGEAPINVRFSLAYMTKRIFYKDIKDELWEIIKEEQSILKDKSIYAAMQAGNQAGMLTRYRKGDPYLFTVHNKIMSFDKKSAYPSYFVRDRYFPIGKVYRIGGGNKLKLRIIQERARAGAWFKIVLHPNHEIDCLAAFKTRGKCEYGIEYWDYRTITEELRIQLLALIEHERIALYGCDHTDYLPLVFRDKIAELYERKNSITDHQSPERYLIKTQLDMLFGKGLQRFDFATNSEVFKKYVCRGDNFMTPQLSNHVVAAMRHELIKVIHDLRSFVLTYDTDGAKLAYNDQVFIYFEHINAYIKRANEIAGFAGCDIGVWDYEGCFDKLIQFAPKVYAYQIGEETVCKFAGVQRRFVRQFLKEHKGEDVFALWERDGLIMEMCRGVKYDTRIKKFLEILGEYRIQREDKDESK